MSRPQRPEFVPLIALVHRANKALQGDMVRQAHARGHPEIKYSHNAVFATLHPPGARATDMAADLGITRQSLGEIVRDMVSAGILETRPDPTDGRARLVTFTDAGLAIAGEGFEYIRALEARLARELGAEAYADFREALVRVAEMLEESDPPTS